MGKKILAAFAFVALSAGASNAAVVFQDDFSSYGNTTKLNAPSSFFGGNWAVSRGSVDYLAGADIDNYGGLCKGNGNCIDLDGSTHNSGLFAYTNFAAGRYKVDIGLIGSGRGTTESVTVSLGDWSTTINAIGSDNDVSNSFSFTTNGGMLSFQNAGGDNIGAILTNVKVSAIPLPAGLPLLALGLGVLGLAGRRRKATKG